MIAVSTLLKESTSVAVYRVLCRDRKTGFLWVKPPHCLKGNVLLRDDGECLKLKDDGTTFSPRRGTHDVIEILHECKDVSQLTAADLDGYAITSSDGGVVLFKHNSVVLWTTLGQRLSSHPNDNPSERRHETAVQEHQAYLAARHRPPSPALVINWQGQYYDRNQHMIQGWCRIGSDNWGIAGSPELGRYMLCRDTRQVYSGASIADAEQFIRNHYAEPQL